MMRRTAVLPIAQFNFGHPSLAKPFGAKAAAGKATATDIEVTVAPNGAKIITHNMDGANVSIGAYMEAGAKFDPSAVPGLNYVFRWAMTTSNMDNSLFQIDRTVRSHGAALEHFEVRKKFVGMRVDARPDMWQKPVENMFTCVSAPRFHEADVERFRDTMDNQLEEMRWQHPRDYVADRIESLCFYKEPLGSDRHIGPHANSACNQTKMLEFWGKHCTPNRVVYAGVNVDHQQLVAAYENAPFPHSGSAPHHTRADKSPFPDQAKEATTFTGGNEYHEQEDRAAEMCTKPDMEPESIAAIAFRSFGRDGSLKDYAAGLVAEQAMNMVIKDAIRYERDDTHTGARSFYRPYSSTGILGVTVRGAPDMINKMILDSFTVVKAINGANLDAAKACAAVAFDTNNLDGSRVYCDFLGTSFNGNTPVSADEIMDAIKGVSAADIARVQKTAAEERPCLYVTGSTLAVPSLRQMGF